MFSNCVCIQFWRAQFENIYSYKYFQWLNRASYQYKDFAISSNITACNYYTWLQISEISEITIYDIDRLEHLLKKLNNIVEQKSSLWFFIDKKVKEEAIKFLFLWNNLKKSCRNVIVILRVKILRIQSNRSILFAESDFFAELFCEPETSILYYKSASHRLE